MKAKTNQRTLTLKLNNYNTDTKHCTCNVFYILLTKNCPCNVFYILLTKNKPKNPDIKAEQQ